jgi:hypothetical protein
VKKTDIGLIVIAVLFAIGLIIINTRQLVGQNSQEYDVVIRVDGALYASYPLDESQTIRIETERGFNEIVIQDGEVVMTDADCNDQICVHTKAITGSGQSIICLPNRVSVEVVGNTNEESEVDDIAQ